MFDFHFKLCVCVEGVAGCACVDAHECGDLRGQKRMSDPLELEFQVAVSYYVCAGN